MEKWLLIIGMGLLCLSLFKKQAPFIHTQTNAPSRAQFLPISSRRGLEEIPERLSPKNTGQMTLKHLSRKVHSSNIAGIDRDSNN